MKLQVYSVLLTNSYVFDLDAAIRLALLNLTGGGKTTSGVFAIKTVVALALAASRGSRFTKNDINFEICSSSSMGLLAGLAAAADTRGFELLLQDSFC